MSAHARPGPGHYERLIVQITGCTRREAAVVEDIMRRDVFQSSLDWQSPEEFKGGVRLAFAALQAMRRTGVLPEEYQRMLEE